VQQGSVLHDLGLAVDMQADGARKEIDKDHPDVRVLCDITQTRQDPIPAILRIDERLGIEDTDKTRQASPERAVARAMGIRGGNKDQLLPRNEGTHERVEMVKHLVVVKREGTAEGPKALLEPMFTA
jgi:hypothetical protein